MFKKVQGNSAYPLSERISFICVILVIGIILGCNICGIRFFGDSYPLGGFYQHRDISYREKDVGGGNNGSINTVSFIRRIRGAYKENPLDVDIYFGPTPVFRWILGDDEKYPLQLESNRIYTLSNGDKYIVWGMR